MEATKEIALRPANTGVAIRRDMAKNPAIMEALEPVERAVFLASTGKIFAEYSGTELAAELKTALKWICRDVGYRITDESDMQYLVVRTAEILKRYYANLSIKDFRIAFEMSITGELDDFLPRGRDGQADRNHYQQFNAEYVCKILNAYKGRRGWIMKKAFEAAPKQEQEPSPAHKEFYRNGVRKDCINAFIQYKYRGYFSFTPVMEMLCYNILASVGLADEIVVTVAEQKEIWNRCVWEFAKRGMIGDINRLKKDGYNATGIDYGAFTLARRKALIKTFDWMVENEIQITDYIIV